jgi:hypothetical protein
MAMDKFVSLVNSAQHYYKVADHLLYVTYPVVGEVKLLLTIVENLYRAGINVMNAVLHYEQIHKRITVLPSSFEERFGVFQKVAKKHKIGEETLQTIKELKIIMDEHKSSAMEFSRSGKYVITAGDFKLKTLDVKLLKNYLGNVSSVISKMGELK